jgi:hypothetical protein
MRGRRQDEYNEYDKYDEYDARQAYGPDADYDEGYDDGSYAEPEAYDPGLDDAAGYDDGQERGLMLQRDESLVGVSTIVTQHGTPILSYTRTMNRFYTTRKQRLSLGRHRCEVCGDRIRFWSYETPTGSHTHDGCYERLAWTWTNLYAQQQRLAAEGRLD